MQRWDFVRLLVHPVFSTKELGPEADLEGREGGGRQAQAIHKRFLFDYTTRSFSASNSTFLSMDPVGEM